MSVSVSLTELSSMKIFPRCVLLLSVACLDLQYFFTLFYKLHDFQEHVFDNETF